MNLLELVNSDSMEKVRLLMSMLFTFSSLCCLIWFELFIIFMYLIFQIFKKPVIGGFFFY